MNQYETKREFSNDDAQKLYERSTSGSSERARIRRAKKRRKERNRRLAVFAIGCMLVGGAITMTTEKVVDSLTDLVTVNDELMEFRKEVIVPNTHRTENMQYYYYDYGDIAEHCMQDGVDCSQEIYKTYASIGETQTNRVLQYTDYGSVAEYTKSMGFDSIDEWVDKEKNKILIQSDIESMNAELSLMNNGSKQDTNNSYGGAK